MRTCHIEIDHSREADALGRRSFTLLWRAQDGRPRGQHYFSQPLRYVRDLRKRGFRVRVGSTYPAEK